MLVHEGLEVLTEDQSLDLVRQEDFGRVGVTVAALPAIFPVNYVVLDDRIVFRTGYGTKLSAAATNAVVAFEVDARDEATRSGWSVLIVGMAEEVHDVGLALRVAASGLEPDADGRRGHLVRIHPELITGRRIVHEYQHEQKEP